jgi:D-alanyl-D-alanine carboxypeptidase (penicillin-binding protein 5/6)
MSFSRARTYALTLFTLAVFCLAACRAEAGPIHAQCAILMDATTGRILFEQRADARIPPASLTKVLSMYVALNAVSSKKKSLHKKFSVSRAAAETGGSRLGLRAGDKVTLDQLLYGMAVASGNDATVATAEYVAGSQAAFVQRMNALARKIGMSRSHFVNPHGLPAKGQMTTARDMMKLAKSYEARYPASRRYHLAPSVTYRGRTEPNHNPLSSWYPGINGLKTGWITAAGYNIIATATRRGHKLIAVVLGAPSTRVRADEAGRLLNAGFAAISRKGGNAAAELGLSARQAAALKKSPAYAQPMKPAPSAKRRRAKNPSVPRRSSAPGRTCAPARQSRKGLSREKPEAGSMPVLRKRRK